MIPEYVIDIKSQKSDVLERIISLPRITEPPKLLTPEYCEWWKENEWLINFTVHVSNSALAKELANELGTAYKENNQEKIKSLLEKLRSLRVLPFDERTLLEKWTHMMRQLPGDIGGPNKKKSELFYQHDAVVAFWRQCVALILILNLQRRLKLLLWIFAGRPWSFTSIQNEQGFFLILIRLHTEGG